MKNVSLKILSALLMLSFTASVSAQKVQGNGQLKTINAEIPSFESINVSGVFDIRYHQHDKTAMQITADENLLEFIQYKVTGNQLSISFEKDINIYKYKEMSIDLYSPNLNKIEVSGVVNFETAQKIVVPAMEIEVSGVANIQMDIATEHFVGEFSGASNCDIVGKSNRVELEFSGAGNFNGINFIAKHYSIEMSGVGNAEIHVKENLSVEISGAGSVSYKGEPKNVHKEISFLGSLNKY